MSASVLRFIKPQSGIIPEKPNDEFEFTPPEVKINRKFMHKKKSRKFKLNDVEYERMIAEDLDHARHLNKLRKGAKKDLKNVKMFIRKGYMPK